MSLADLFPHRAAVLARKVAPDADPTAALQASIERATAELDDKQQRLEALVAQVDALTAAHATLQPLVASDMDPAAPAVAALAAAIERGTETIATLAAAVEQLLVTIEADQRELETWDQAA
jgi:ABC-type transporter Mla subunit MlaD